MLDDPRQLRWLCDHGVRGQPDPPAYVEFSGGDRLPGKVLEFVGRSELRYHAVPEHLIVRSPTLSAPPDTNRGPLVRVGTNYVRRIVWEPSVLPYEPGTVVLRNGSRVWFRAVRWGARQITLLTQEGREQYALSEIATLNLPVADPWNAYYSELALLSPRVRTSLFQIETNQGIVATTSWNRQRIITRGKRDESVQWIHGLQPAWSLDMLWIDGPTITLRCFFSPWEVPLSRIEPRRVEQHSPLAQTTRRWQRNRNVEGSRLRDGRRMYGWGFGVHAGNRLEFPLPDSAAAVQMAVGLDRLADTGGCVQARIYDQAARRLFESPALVGSHSTVDTGRRPLAPSAEPRRLALDMAYAPTSPPPGADPLDIRDSADWFDPIVFLSQPALSAQVARLTSVPIPAWYGWELDPTSRANVQLTNVWDELSERESAYRPAVIATSDAGLTLRRTWKRTPRHRWLIVLATSPQSVARAPRISVKINGRQVGSWDVPTFNRDQFHVEPFVISLEPWQRDGVDRLELEVTQSSGDPMAAVQWHTLQISDQHPARYELRRSAEAAIPGDTNEPTVCQLPAGGQKRFDLPQVVRLLERPDWGHYRYLKIRYRLEGDGRALIKLVGAKLTEGGQVEEDQRFTATEHGYSLGAPSLDPERLLTLSGSHDADGWTVATCDPVRDFGELPLAAVEFSTDKETRLVVDSVQFVRTQAR